MTVTNEPAEFFLHYAQHVLGLRHLPLPVQEAPRLLILDIPWPEGLARDEMFQKMMSAVGLESRDFDLLECLPAEVHGHLGRMNSYRFLFSFSPEISAEIEHQRSVHGTGDWTLWTAAGPRDLRVDPSQKRATWENLKQLQLALKNS